MPTEYTGLPTPAERAAFKRAELHRSHYCETCVGDAYQSGYNDGLMEAEERAEAATPDNAGRSPKESPMDANLPFPTTDASKWAAEFIRLHGGTILPAHKDDGLMLAWFANAIEHGRGSDNAGRSPIDVETWNAAIDAAMDAVGNVVPVRKVGAAVDIARSDALVALLGVRRLSESTGSEEGGPTRVE